MTELRFHVNGRATAVTVEEKGGLTTVAVGAGSVEVESYEIGEDAITVQIGGSRHRICYHLDRGHVYLRAPGACYDFAPASEEDGTAQENRAFSPEIVSPMPGKVIEVTVAEGDEVRAGQGLLLLEAMKMEQTLRAPVAARVTTVCVKAGEMVPPGAVLLRLEKGG